MKQLRQIKMYSFNRGSISEGQINSENVESLIVTLTDSFLTFALEKYLNREIANGELITEIIKVMLPPSEEDAKNEWQNGLTFNGDKYYGWFATTGGMKKESNGKCETFFIREDCRSFADELEEIISLGKFKEIEVSNEEVCINKDILSRLSLATSSAYMAGNMPDFIVLPQPTFRIVKDYKTVEKYTKQIEEKTVVDYKLVDVHFDEDVDMFDGGAIATPDVFLQIQESLKLDYPVEFAIIRGYGIGIKGMITKFDIIGYLDSIYKEDTEYFRKLNGQYQFKDMWDEWQTVTEKTMLLNESMVKLAKYYNADHGENMSTYQSRLNQVESKYKDIINKLYVTKVNKRDEDIEDYRRTNYQLINALALSKADYMELLRNDVKSYQKILKPFDKSNEQDEWLINIDTIRLFFRNLVKSDLEDSEALHDEIVHMSQNVVTKCEELLHISEDFVKLKYVKNNLARLIEKKSRELASGKFTVKAKYQYIAVCPISYLNFAMTREQGEEGLQAGQFYSADCNNGDIRTISRNPLCAYSEVHNVTFVRSEKLDKWLSPCRELIYFNQQSDILSLMSSADTDGDACTVIDNEIIRNAVVVPQDGKYFINQDDGHKEMMQYNAENRFLATYRASGNLIGKISLKAASINSDSQRTLDYYDVAKGEFTLFNEIDIEDKEERKAFIQEKIDSGEWLTTYKASEQHRAYIKQRFYENEKDIYTVLYNAMVSIDAPKTLYFPSDDDMQIINEKYNRKAWFLQYRENKENVVSHQYEYTFGLLDSVSKWVKIKLLDEINAIQTKFDNRSSLIQEKLVNGDYNLEHYNECLAEVESLYLGYSKERQDVRNEAQSKRRILDKNSKEEQEKFGWDQYLEMDYQARLREIRTEQFKQFKEIDANYFVQSHELIEKYEMPTLANAIGNLKNCTEDFIINLFYPVFGYLNEKLQSKRYVYKKDPNGDIEFLSERYTNISHDFLDNTIRIKKQYLEDKKNYNLISVNADIRARVLDESVIELIETELIDNNELVFDIQVKDDKVLLMRNEQDLLEVFPDKLQIKEYNLLNCSRLKVELMPRIASTRRSITLTITEITI